MGNKFFFSFCLMLEIMNVFQLTESKNIILFSAWLLIYIYFFLHMNKIQHELFY